LFFYANDRDEPRHVHLERDEKTAKFWLDPVRLQRSGAFNRTRIVRIERIVEQNHSRLIEAWDEYFSD
jgi:hypothetical protein